MIIVIRKSDEYSLHHVYDELGIRKLFLIRVWFIVCILLTIRACDIVKNENCHYNIHESLVTWHDMPSLHETSGWCILQSANGDHIQAWTHYLPPAVAKAQRSLLPHFQVTWWFGGSKYLSQGTEKLDATKPRMENPLTDVMYRLSRRN